MAFWHPFADMGAVSRHELIIDRGEGPWVFDADGNRYLDGTASLWYANLGHGRQEIIDAVAAQMGRLEAYHTFADVANRPANELCERLAPPPRSRTPRSFSPAAAVTRSRSRPSSPAATSSTPGS